MTWQEYFAVPPKERRVLNLSRKEKVKFYVQKHYAAFPEKLVASDFSKRDKLTDGYVCHTLGIRVADMQIPVISEMVSLKREEIILGRQLAQKGIFLHGTYGKSPYTGSRNAEPAC